MISFEKYKWNIIVIDVERLHNILIYSTHVTKKLKPFVECILICKRHFELFIYKYILQIFLIVYVFSSIDQINLKTKLWIIKTRSNLIYFIEIIILSLLQINRSYKFENKVILIRSFFPEMG